MSKTKHYSHEKTPIHATFVTRRNAPSDGYLLLWGPEEPDRFDWSWHLRQLGLGDIPESHLPPAETRLILPARDGRYRIEMVRGRRLDMSDALRILGTTSFSGRRGKRRQPCASIVAWSYAAKFALELISRQCFVPMLKTNGHELYAIWQAAIEGSLDIGRVRQLASIMPVCAHALYSIPHNRWDKQNRGNNRRRKPTMMWHPEALVRAFLDVSIDAYMRSLLADEKNAALIADIRAQIAALPGADTALPWDALLLTKYGIELSTLQAHARRMVELTLEQQRRTQARFVEDESAETAFSVHVSGEADRIVEDETGYSGDESPVGDVYESLEAGEDVEGDEDESQETDEIGGSALEGSVEDRHLDSMDMDLLEEIDPELYEAMCIDCLRKLMPMKEYVYPTLKSHDELPSWEHRWYEALIGHKQHSRMEYHLEDPDLVASMTAWFSPVHESDAASDVNARTGFWLEAPTAETENMWFLRYVLVAVEDPSLAIPAGVVFSIGTERLRVGQHSFEHPQEQLLTDLGKAAHYFEPLEQSLEQSKPEGVFLDVRQAWRFISEVSPLLYSAGFDVRLPEQLTDQGSRRLRARFRICDARPEDMEQGYFGLNDLAGFQWEAALGDEVVSVEEFREIVALKQPLIQWRGSWVLVDPVQLRDIEHLIESNETHGTLTRFEAMNRALTGVADPSAPDSNIEVVVEGKIAEVLERLTQEDIADVTMKAPALFRGTLRPYQERGVAWLSYQQRLGLGCCLADDMGLGKTIQLICHVLNHVQRYPEDKRGTLLICPMSVVGNWKREFARFAPSIHVVVHHGNSKAQDLRELRQKLSKPGTVVITTYGLITRGSDFLFAHHWAHVVLDEAQAIKNASSKRSMIVRELKADFRVALTGTPIENRLAELWSILDFLNPGLLGTHARFQRLYGVPIERNNDEKALDRLRNLVSPFILRRVKSDPNIIQDLPDKMENKVYCTLTREQATMYQALVDSAMQRIEDATGIARHGHVLALLTHLKQIVDHPVLYQKGTPLSAERSGKMQRIIEMLETIIENGEKALIFSQFKEMGDVLVDILQQELHLESVPFLHGGLSASQRDALVSEFQSEDGPPVFVLSLKAGGTGLNLTQATHVFHFDRWWNPAVEEQATDRAFRIGQRKNVQVHKFLTLGTLEEKIDTMLEEKKSLSDSIVDATGAWVTQLDADALRELFSLSSDAMIDEAD